ncbi:protein TRIGALACTOSYLDIACYLGLYCEROL 2, chloroplastic isoform X1 [Triticum aestivum]|uniref:protein TRIGALACTOSYLDIACYLGLYCEROL 2, chloroplastic isoform X1 n=1 Tax=Triticum aestivum TaxID=4565 RepID=UPI000842E0BB|nr:protein TRIGALACTOSYLDIACYLGLYCEROL 2, chloroplastic-like isoform X1 [Triticum aestivum]
MRRLAAAPPRPLLHPHVSPALGVLQQHGRVAMARTTPVACCSYLLPNRRTLSQGAEFEPLRSRSTDRDRGSAMARAKPVSASGGEASPDGGMNPFAPLVELWRRTVQPLGDYGFGKRSVWEGGVGLFMVSGAALLALALAWLRGFQLRSRFRKYSAVFEFSQACGICVGTPLRIRGVTVGSVVRVDSSLRSIDAYVEVEDDKIIVPRNSFVEVNQSGLLMETMVDITPKDPLPTPSVGPLDADCSKEGLILCDKERMKGQQGVSLDAMVGIFTRLGRDMEEIGVHKSFKLAEKVASIMEEAQPLLSRIEALAEEVQPLLSKVGDSDLVKDVETIAKGLADASGDLRGNTGPKIFCWKEAE